jgi:hypothetical protein
MQNKPPNSGFYSRLEKYFVIENILLNFNIICKYSGKNEIPLPKLQARNDIIAAVCYTHTLSLIKR